MAATVTIPVALFLFLQFTAQIGAAKFTIINKCSRTIWPAILGSPPLETTGFQLPDSASRSFQVPTGWSGRFWARTGCHFTDNSGSCATGDCGSNQLECNGSGATAVTLVEFTLGSDGSMDFYDVSLVDGFNLPVTVEPRGGNGACAATGCMEDVNQRCPVELRTGGGGACRSACDAFSTQEYCCKGAYASPATCRPSAYSQVFKAACPKSYSYAFDDATSTFTCAAADYVITFCPSAPSQKSSKPDDGPAADPGSEPEPEYGSGSCSGQTAMLADGSWLASLAIGATTRQHSATGVAQILAVLVGVVHLAGEVVHLKLLHLH